MDFESLEREEILRGVKYDSFAEHLQRAQGSVQKRAEEEELPVLLAVQHESPTFAALPRPASPSTPELPLKEVVKEAEDSVGNSQKPTRKLGDGVEIGPLPSGFLAEGVEQWPEIVHSGLQRPSLQPVLDPGKADSGRPMQRYTKADLHRALFITSLLGERLPTLPGKAHVAETSRAPPGQRRLPGPDQLQRVLHPEVANKMLCINLRLAISGEQLPPIRMRMWDTVASLRCKIACMAGRGGAVQILWRDQILQTGHMSLGEVGLGDDDEVMVLRAPFRFALTVCDSGAAKLWGAGSGTCLHTLEHTGTVRTAACSPDGSHVLTASIVANIWNSETGQPVSRLAGHTCLIRSAAFSSDGLRVITTSDDETARIWRTLKGTCLQKLAAGPGQVIAGQFSPDGASVLTAAADGIVKCWELPTANCMNTFRGNRHAASTATFSPDGAAVMVAASTRVDIWSARTGQLRQTLKGHRRDVLSSSFSSDGTSIVTASLDGTARLWKVKLEEFMSVVGTKSTMKLEHDSAVRAASFSPDSSLVLTTSLDGAAQLWSSLSGEVLHVLSGHGGPILSAEFSTDSSLVITASDDTSAKIWNAETGECLQTLQGHPAAVSYAYLLPA